MKRVPQVFLESWRLYREFCCYNMLSAAQWEHSWHKSILVILPEFGTIIAVFELHHSAKANELRNERNSVGEGQWP